MQNVPPETLPNYLTPMREEREYKESQKGKNEIDWAAIKEKAKMNGSLKNHAPTIISHLSSQELVDMHNKMPSEYKLKKEKYNRESTKSHTEAEMDKFLNSR